MHVPILRGCKSCSEPIAGQRGSREGLRHQHRTRSSGWKSCSESRATECHRPTAQTLFLLLFASQPALPLLLARLGYPEPLTSRPDTPPNTQRKDKTGKGSGATEARPLPALLQRSRPSLPAPGGIASLQIPPRGQLPGSRGGRSSAPRAAPQPRVAVPLRVLMPPRNLLYSFESIALPGAPRLSRTHWAGGVPQRSARPTTAALWPPQPCAS